MRKTRLILATALASLSIVGVSGTAAFADHCTAEGPGHSYYGNDHTVERAGQKSAHNEGDHNGFSDCNPSDPSTRPARANG